MEGDYLASELLCNGELFDFIDCEKGAFSEAHAKRLFLQMLAGLTYMHNKGLVNRDIKLENMLVDENLDLKIADFGFAMANEGRDQSGTLQTVLGTPGYMAPEILENLGY